MKLTAREEYGLRCLLQLARYAGRAAPVTVRSVAESEGISAAYAEKLLRELSQARLAESIRGIHGGYRMARRPEDVTLGEVIRALGGFLTPVNLCGRFTGDRERCVHTDDCGVRPVWISVSAQIERFLDQLKLSTLLESEQSVTGHVEMVADHHTRTDTFFGVEGERQ